MAGTTRTLEMTTGTTRTLELGGLIGSSDRRRTAALAEPKGPARGAGADRLLASPAAGTGADRLLASPAAGAGAWVAELAHHAGGLLAILAAVALWAWILAGVLAPLSGTLARIHGDGDPAPSLTARR